MLLLTTLTAAVLSQATPQAPLQAAPSAPNGCAVLVTRNEGLTADEAATAATTVGDALKAAGIPVVLAQAEIRTRAGDMIKGCAGKAPCLSGVGRSLGAGAVVTVDVAQVFGELSFELALVDVATANSLADKVFAAPADSPLIAAELEEFARTSRYALLTLPAFNSQVSAGKPPRSDTPRVTSLTPKDPGLASNNRPLPLAAYVTTGGAAAAGVATAVFGVLTLLDWQRTIPDVNKHIQMRQSEVPGYHQKQLFTGIAGAVTAGLTSAAVYFWLNPPQSPVAAK